MKRRSLKDKQDCLLLSSAKLHKGFSKINTSVNYLLQKWIIYHPRVIKCTFANDCITFKFDGGKGGVETELRQKVIT